jgi:hypothetical protein
MVKAACHIHSDWSYDGSWPLERIASAFSRRGYRILLMTEHDRGFTAERFVSYRAECESVSSEKILVMPGIEYSDAKNIVHVLVWGNLPFLGENLETTKLLKLVREHDGIAIMAHPTRRNAHERFNPAWVEYLLGIETWNRKTDGWAPSRTAPNLLSDSRLLPFVGLDFHNWRQSFPLAMEIEIVGEPTEKGVVDSLRSAQYTATAFGIGVEKLTGVSGAISSLSAAERVRRIVAHSLR